MRRFLLPLLTALALPTAVNAEPTWVRTYSSSNWCEVLGYRWMPKSECKRILGDTFYVPLVGKYETFVDAKSIVNRGPIRDFRTKMTYCDNKYGPVDCFEKFNSSTYNCAKNSYYSESLGGWVVDFPEQNMPFDKYYDEEKYKGRSPASLANINYVCSDY